MSKKWLPYNSVNTIANQAKIYTDSKIAELASVTLDAISQLDSNKQDKVNGTYGTYPVFNLNGNMTFFPAIPGKNCLKGCDFSDTHALDSWTRNGQCSLMSESTYQSGFDKLIINGLITCSPNVTIGQKVLLSSIGFLKNVHTLSIFTFQNTENKAASILKSINVTTIGYYSNVTQTLINKSNISPTIFYKNMYPDEYNICIYTMPINPIDRTDSEYLSVSFSTSPNNYTTIIGIKLETGPVQTLFYKSPDMQYPILIPQ